jgi:hypothetical protein
MQYSHQLKLGQSMTKTGPLVLNLDNIDVAKRSESKSKKADGDDTKLAYQTRVDKTKSCSLKAKHKCGRCVRKDDRYSLKRKQILNKMNGNLLLRTLDNAPQKVEFLTLDGEENQELAEQKSPSNTQMPQNIIATLSIVEDDVQSNNNADDSQEDLLDQPKKAIRDKNDAGSVSKRRMSTMHSIMDEVQRRH